MRLELNVAKQREKTNTHTHLVFFPNLLLIQYVNRGTVSTGNTVKTRNGSNTTEVYFSLI